ncbi:SIR2 family protein [Pelagibacterium sp.]|uniref:SIR2 family protein n=2 Tax=Pelagibacterium sp. TaxID=1967288 RepID=UPI003C7CEA01
MRTLLREHRQPILLLGAGASKKSGVPDAWETVNRAAKWAWCKEYGRSFADPGVVSSDWQPWLESQPWFKKGVGLADQYPVAVDNLLGIADDKREFFEHIISRGVQPSEGYRALARIMDNGWIATVLTTNFDHCLHRAVILENAPPHLVEIRTPSDWTRFMTSPANPQLIHIHGSVEHYSDMNLATEVAKLDPDVVERLRPLLRDHPLIVVGYRGMEASVMTDLLFDQCDYTNGFNKGIFWCDMKRNISEPLSPMTQRLADAIGSNFNRVPIDGFDHLLRVDLYDQLVAAKVPPKALGPVIGPIELPPDMQVFDDGAYGDLDERLLFSRLQQYAKKHSEPSPDRFDAKWVEDIAAAKKLIQQDADADTPPAPTLAGWLMFAKQPTTTLPHAAVKLTVKGPEGWLLAAFGGDVDLVGTDTEGEFVVERNVGGTLWNQLNVLIEITALLNAPFVLKESKSRDVTPYHPQALKEMIVNALVHRDYNVAQPIQIIMMPTQIETISPGGLTEEVAAKTGGEEIESLIRGGSRGELKGYRNPVISGLFYGSSEMDRKGSGLSDMFQKTVDNNGEVHFGPTEGNTSFRVVIFARPEAVDEITRTAVADQSETVRFTTNLAEFVSIPDRIWHASTTAKSVHGLKRAAEDLPVPPGYVQDGRFFTFYDLTRLTSDLVTPFDVDDVEELTIQELFEQGNGLNILRKLLHDSVDEHLRAIGLVVDEDRRRAHFSRGEEPNRKITYQGRVKRATRTIVKARTKRDSDDVLYYEHKSFSYSIMAFGVDWGLFINPGYVFTRDGRSRYLGRERINILSTKRAARDFNPSVMHDVSFWMACLSEEAEGVFALRTEHGNELAEYAPAILLNSAFPGIAFNSSVFDGGRSIDDELDTSLSEVDLELEDLAAEDDDDYEELHDADDNEVDHDADDESEDRQ